MIAVDRHPTTEARPEHAPLRVCHVSLTLQTGGLERLLVEFARFHERDVFDVEFAAMGEVGQPAEDIRSSGCQVHVLHSTDKGRWERIRDLADVLRHRDVDVVHTHNAYPHLYATIAARMAGVKAVVHTRHGRRFGQTISERLQFALSSRLASRTVAVSDDTADLCRRLGWLNDRQVTRIWNGIDLDRFPYHGPVAEPIAISVARLSDEKDFPTLIEATRLVRDEIPDFRLRIVGDGPRREELERLAGNLNLNGTIEFLGERSDIPELLSRSAMFVSSSSTEGISLTLLEAMATGLPIAATRVGGNPEIVVHEQTGLLVPPESPSSLANAVRDLCQRPDVWSPWGRAGRDRVEQHFSIRGMVSAYEDLYRELVQAP